MNAYAIFSILILVSLSAFCLDFFSNIVIQKIQAILYLVAFFMLGVFVTQLHNIKHNSLHFQHYISAESETHFTAVVIENPKQLAKSKRAKVRIEHIVFANNHKSVEGSLLLYFKSQDTIELGDKILVSSKINSIKEAEYPFQFDYKKHWLTQQIQHQGFVSQYVKIGKSYSLASFALKWRNHFVQVLNMHLHQEQTRALASALILGDDDALSYDIINDFKNTGTIHVLSVSGMHVGIFYAGITWFFRRMNNNKLRNRIFRFLLISICIASYALLTGMSAPVVRAAIMLFFIELGNVFQRENNMYNTIATSAFIQLLANPFQILNIGFQLSYTAVFGLIYLVPKLNSLFYHRNKWINGFIKSVNVTIAAQVITFPILCYYFGQFPVYFVFSNLIIGLLSSLAIYGGLLLLLFSKIHLLAIIIGNMLNGILNAIIRTADVIGSLSFNSIYFHKPLLLELVLWLIVIMLFALLVKHFTAKRFTLLLLVLFVSVICYNYRVYAHASQEAWIYIDDKNQHSAYKVVGNTLYESTSTTLNTERYNQNKQSIIHFYNIDNIIQVK